MHDDSPRVTMVDLARQVGVSQSTVSRALQNHPRISQETRDRVQKIAREMGFRPDPALAALTTYRSSKQKSSSRDTLAILCVGDPAVHLRDSGNDRKVKGIRHHAEALGYTTEMFILDPAPARQKQLSRILYSRGIRGIIVCPLPVGCSNLDYIDWQKFTAVTIGYSLESPLLDYVTQDHRCDMVYAKLKELGYSRIGYCATASRENNYRFIKLSEYLKCLYQDSIPTEKSPPLFYPRGQLDPIPWIESYGFDAIMTADAQYLIDKLKDSPYTVPREMAVASLCMHLDKATETGISASIVDDDLTGAIVVDQLHKNLCHGHLGVPRHRQAVMLDNTWYPGATALPKGEINDPYIPAAAPQASAAESSRAAVAPS